SIRNCTFTNVMDAVNSNSQPHGLLVENNIAPNQTSIRGYFCWVQGDDIVIAGNTAKNSTREHIIRVGGANKLELAYNNFANEDHTNTDSQDIAKAAFNIQKASYVYIVGNTVTNGGIGLGLLGGGAGMDQSNATLTYAV